MTAYADCQRCGQSVAFYSPGALLGFQMENARRADAGREPFPTICDACRASDRAPQGEPLSLFTPAPTQMAGQTFLEV